MQTFREKISDIEDTYTYLQKEGIPHQLLFRGEQHNFNNDPFKPLHDDYTDVTGLRIHNGPVREGINLYTLDIDCKEIPEEGRELFTKLLERHPVLNQTYHERTKSGGYHILIYSDLKVENLSKWIFNTPFGIEVPYDKNLEIELFINSPVTIAPSNTPGGSYEPLNDNQIKLIPRKEWQRVLFDIQSNSNWDKPVKKGGSCFVGEQVTEEEEKGAVEAAVRNGLKVIKKGKYLYAYNGKSRRVIQITNNKYFIYRFSDGSRVTLREYIESLGRDYIPSPYEISKWRKKIEDIKRKMVKDTTREVVTLAEGEQLADREDILTHLLSFSSGTLLLDGGCGIGKTYVFIKEVLPRWGGISVVAVPTTILKNQIGEDYNLMVLGGRGTTGRKLLRWNEYKEIAQEGDIVVCCYEALKQADLEDFKKINLVIDEAHKITDDASYRKLMFLVGKLKEAKRGILLSGTTFDIPMIYDEVLEVRGGKKFPVNLYRVMSEGKTFTKRQRLATFEKLKASCKKHNIPLMVICDTKLAQKRDYLGMEILTAQDKDHEIFQGLISEGLQPDLCGFTMLINEGVNIYTKGRVAIWVDIEPSSTKASTIIQLAQRWREAERIDLYVVDKKGHGKWYSEDEVLEDIAKTLDTLNRKKEFSEIFEDTLNLILPYLRLEDEVFSFREELFKTYHCLINRQANQTKATLEFVSDRMVWSLKDKTIVDMAEDAPQEDKHTPPKTKLKKVLLDENKKLKEGATLIFTELKEKRKPERCKRLLEKHREILGEFLEAYEDPGVNRSVRRLLELWEDNGKDIKTNLEDYFRCAPGLSFEVPSEIMQQLIPENTGYFIDTQRFTGTQKFISENYGHIFTIGQHAKNEKIARYCLKRAGMNVKKSECQQYQIIYKNSVTAKRGTKLYKEQKSKLISMIGTALEKLKK